MLALACTRSGTRRASARLGRSSTALPDPDLKAILGKDPRDLHIGPVGKGLVALDLRAPSAKIRGGCISDKDDGVRIANVDTCNLKQASVYLERFS